VSQRTEKILLPVLEAIVNDENPSLNPPEYQEICTSVKLLLQQFEKQKYSPQ